jgi:hypothetical protein
MKKPRSLPRFFHMIDGVCSRHMNTAENRNRLRHGFLHAAGYRDNTVAIVNIKVSVKEGVP